MDIVFFGGALKKALLHTRNGAAGHGGKLANIGIGIDGKVDVGIANRAYTQHNDLSLSILKIGIATETSVAMPICSLFYDIIIPQMVTFVNSKRAVFCENIVGVGMPGCGRTGEILRRAEKALYGRRKQLAKLCKVHMLRLEHRSHN
ncbi:hypothetical protein GMD59_14865 [Ruthenibacterium lactatiformans]|uniref:Uncharacterized protein n=1 Tax=Ruthenibacterium lactatiformans TaxID=1550024 RepID=A0A6L6LV25_9FIRM|nr:hypothetical protein [Ruthenibacterium lactatiformans]MTS28557.1 hypothetical protein [Ruthenibacterium lactatiformans]